MPSTCAYNQYASVNKEKSRFNHQFIECLVIKTDNKGHFSNLGIPFLFISTQNKRHRVSEITTVLCQHTDPDLSNLADTITLFRQKARDSPRGQNHPHICPKKLTGIMRVQDMQVVNPRLLISIEKTTEHSRKLTHESIQ